MEREDLNLSFNGLYFSIKITIQLGMSQKESQQEPNFIRIFQPIHHLNHIMKHTVYKKYSSTFIMDIFMQENVVNIYNSLKANITKPMFPQNSISQTRTSLEIQQQSSM